MNEDLLLLKNYGIESKILLNLTSIFLESGQMLEKYAGFFIKQIFTGIIFLIQCMVL
jgi:hypothetical protein